MFVVAHVSDTHFGNDVQDPAGRAAAVMDHLLAMNPRPDVLVLTGDVADHGLAHEYAAARAWLDRWPGPSPSAPATTTCGRRTSRASASSRALSSSTAASGS